MGNEYNLRGNHFSLCERFGIQCEIRAKTNWQKKTFWKIFENCMVLAQMWRFCAFPFSYFLVNWVSNSAVGWIKKAIWRCHLCALGIYDEHF